MVDEAGDRDRWRFEENGDQDRKPRLLRQYGRDYGDGRGDDEQVSHGCILDAWCDLAKALFGPTV